MFLEIINIYLQCFVLNRPVGRLRAPPFLLTILHQALSTNSVVKALESHSKDSKDPIGLVIHRFREKYPHLSNPAKKPSPPPPSPPPSSAPSSRPLPPPASQPIRKLNQSIPPPNGPGFNRSQKRPRDDSAPLASRVGGPSPIQGGSKFNNEGGRPPGKPMKKDSHRPAADQSLFMMSLGVLESLPSILSFLLPISS